MALTKNEPIISLFAMQLFLNKNRFGFCYAGHIKFIIGKGINVILHCKKNSPYKKVFTQGTLGDIQGK
jgi:hypothetical protein